MNSQTLKLLTVLIAFNSSLANAANVFSYNFANIADESSLPSNWGSNPKGEMGAPTLNFSQPTSGTGPGLSAIGYSNVSSTTASRGTAAYAYLDSGSAGMGVCGNIDGSAQCSVSSDDNITQNEMLKLTFTTPITLNDIAFKNGDHNAQWNSTNNAGFYINSVFVGFDKLNNSGSADGILGHLSSSELTTLGLASASNTWTFLNLNATPNAQQEIYLSSISGISAVPVPGAVWLMGSGLFGLVGISRRKKASRTV